MYVWQSNSQLKHICLVLGCDASSPCASEGFPTLRTLAPAASWRNPALAMLANSHGSVLMCQGTVPAASALFASVGYAAPLQQQRGFASKGAHKCERACIRDLYNMSMSGA